MNTYGYGIFRKVMLAIALLALGAIGSKAYAQDRTILWSENWESNWEDRWHADYGTWEVGAPTSGPGAAHGGVNCAATILAGPYAPSQNTRIIRDIPFVVPQASESPRLRFWTWYNFGSWDYGYVQIRIVGQPNWTTLPSGQFGYSQALYSNERWTRPLYDLSAYAGENVEICFYFTSDGGGNSAPGWYIDDVSVETGTRSYTNPEDWESGFDDWYTDFGTWEVGAPSNVGPTSAYSGSKCAGTIIDGPYLYFAYSRLISPPITVPQASESPRLRFWTWYNFGSFDNGFVQIRIVGQPNWTTLPSGQFGYSQALYSNERWTRPLYDLSAYAGENVEICFYFTSDGGGNSAPGWYIDDVTVETGTRTYSNPEDWESGFDDWYTDFGTWEVGTPSNVGPDSAYSGSKCAGTIIDGPYLYFAYSRLISPPITVPQASESPRLRFWTWYNFGSFDNGYVQIRIVGQPNWTTLPSGQFGYSQALYSDERWTRPLYDLSAYAGENVEICFYFTSDGGGNSAPGWYIDDVTVETGTRTYSNPEDWESGFDDWYTDFGTWEVGTPSNVGPDSAYSGSKCAGTIIDGPYLYFAYSRLISPPITVPQASESPRLRFWTWYNFGSFDNGYVQIRIVGQPNWTTLPSGQFGYSQALYSDERWTRPLYDLSAYAGENVEICFYFTSDGGGNSAPGWYIDDVSVETGTRSYTNPEDWESGFDDWYSDFGTWEVGTPSNVGPDSAYSGSKCAGTIIDGPYLYFAYSRLISPPITLPAASGHPVLRFRNWYDFGSYDYGQVQMRVVGEANWKVLEQYTGNSADQWTYPRIDSLLPYAGSTVQFCFYISSDGGTNTSPGWYIDDIKIVTTCPYIYCPLDTVRASYPGTGEVCIPLEVWNADTVLVSAGTWANNQFCFTPDTLGTYGFSMVAYNAACNDTCDFTVRVSGVKVEHETVAPGGTVAVPITLTTNQPLAGLTIPLRYSTKQPAKVTLDSVVIDPAIGGTVLRPDDSTFIVYRPIQPPPLPPDSLGAQTVGYAYFRVAPDAAPETIPIDTVTAVYNAITYSYNFIYESGDTVVPLFVPGSVTVTGVIACGDFNGDGGVDIADIWRLILFIFAEGTPPVDPNGGDVNCDGQPDISDAVYMIAYIFANGTAPCANCGGSPSLGKESAADAAVWVDRETAGDKTFAVVKVASSLKISGVQLELGSSQPSGLAAASLVSSMQMFSGLKDGYYRVGLIDMIGTTAIPAGESAILRIPLAKDQDVNIISAILAGPDGHPLAVQIKAASSQTALPTKFELGQNHPNPFNPTTMIDFSIPKATQVRLEIFNTLGQRVGVLLDDFRPAGSYRIEWNGNSSSGQPVASGVYFYRIQAGEFTSTRSMVLLK